MIHLSLLNQINIEINFPLLANPVLLIRKYIGTFLKYSLVCAHNKEKRLKLLIIGHNPSEHAWKSGNMYSNPTNRMWKILTGTFAPEISKVSKSEKGAIME